MAIERAWVRFAPGASPTIRGGKRISSVARTTGGQAGDYTITLTEDLVNTDGAVRVSLGGITAIETGNRIHYYGHVATVNTIRVITLDVTTTLTDASELSVFVDTDADGSIGA